METSVTSNLSVGWISSIKADDMRATSSRPPVPSDASSTVGSAVAVTAAMIAFASVAVIITAANNEKFAWFDVTQSSSSGATPTALDASSTRDAAWMADLQYRYGQLRRSIEHMAALDDGDAFYLDVESASSSLAFAQLLEAFRVSPPRVFPHGGDTLVFEWSRDEGKRYVTFSEGVARVRDTAGGEFARAERFDLKSQSGVARLVQALGGDQWRVKQANQSI